MKNLNAQPFIVFLILIISGDVFAKDLELLILHNNDMHSRFEETNKLSGTCPKNKAGLCYGGFARVAHVIRTARAKANAGDGPQVLYLNAGDTYTGTAWFTVHRWKIAAEFLNILNPDAMSLGNHEFDDGVRGLVPFLDALKFPVVTANVDFSEEPDLAATSLKPSIILTIADHKIGIMGYLTPETQIIAQTEKVIFKDEVSALTAESEKLKSEGATTIIALGHSGFEMDKIIAAQVPLVDLVVGGHTNTFLYNGPHPDAEIPEALYPTIMTQKSGKKVPVVQAYAYTKYMGQLTLMISSDGSIKSFHGQPLLLNSTIPQDNDVLQVLDKYREEVSNLDKMVAGRTKVILDATDCRIKECNFGNLIADAFIAYKSYFYGGSYWTDTPISFQNGGGIRNSIDAVHKQGNITRGDLLGVLPFDNQMISLSLNGSDLLHALETGVRSNGETSRGEFLQVSGLHVVMDTSKPAGSRIVEVKTRCSMCSVPKYEKLDPRKEYRVMVTQFLLNGGDGFTVIRDKAYKIVREDLNDVDMVTWYLNNYNPVFPEIDGRIIDISRPNKEELQSSSAQMMQSVPLVALIVIIFGVKMFT